MSGYYGGSISASDITSGTLIHERGGLEADVSAYSGLVEITGGATTQATPGTDYALPKQVTASITASTTQTQGQGALTLNSGVTDLVAIVATCANANDTITLPAAAAGLTVFVANKGAQTMQIFPASGDNLGEGANTATTLAAGATATFVAYDSTNWEPIA